MGRYYLIAALLLIGTAVYAQQQNGTDNKSTTENVFVSNEALNYGASENIDRIVPGNDTRVSLSLDDVPLKDAVKDVCDQCHANYVIDKDVPEDARVTVHAKGLKVSTALDVVTQAANVGWDLQSNYTVTSNKPDKSAHITYRITKSPRKNGFWSANVPVFTDLRGITQNKGVYTLTPQLNTSATFFQNGKVFGLDNGKGTSYNYLYNVLAPERQSTFICPHCKGEITIVRKPHVVKCPKCGRELQPGWQYCPNDGTKRPPDPGEWKFCPLCGKPIDVEN